MKVKCICIDDTNKPKEIPSNKWVQKDKEYHIIHVYVQVNQGNIQGVDLAEISLDESCAPYQTFRLSRFAINIDDLPKLIELMKLCTELKDIDIEKLIKEEELIYIENE